MLGILLLIMMSGLFLMLVSAVSLIQDKKYFTSAPKEVQEVILPRQERFVGAHALGWSLMGVSLLMIVGPVFYLGRYGISHGYLFQDFFLRFLLMFWGLKAFDIGFFDWVLLCHSNFYPHFYPETKGVVGPHLFGFNWKSHVIHIIGCVFLSMILSFVCVNIK